MTVNAKEAAYANDREGYRVIGCDDDIVDPADALVRVFTALTPSAGLIK